MNSIFWTPKAAKQLRKIDRQHQGAIRDGVGNYRVLFDWDAEIRIIDIQEVRKRDERTY